MVSIFTMTVAVVDILAQGYDVTAGAQYNKLSSAKNLVEELGVDRGRSLI